MENTEEKILSKKSIIGILVILIILLVIPAGVKLATQQQVLRSRASGEGLITFVGPGVSADKTTTTSRNIEVELRSPWSLNSPIPTVTPTVATSSVNALVITNVDINPTSVVANGTTQYTVTESADNPGGGENIDTEYVLINHQGDNAGSYRGYVGWTKTSTFLSWGTTHTSPISCSGGGLAAIYTGLGEKISGGSSYTGSEYIKLNSCSTSVNGYTRTVAFNVSFNNNFTTPVNHNTLSGLVSNTTRDASIGSDASGWKQFGTFSLQAQ